MSLLAAIQEIEARKAGKVDQKESRVDRKAGRSTRKTTRLTSAQKVPYQWSLVGKTPTPLPEQQTTDHEQTLPDDPRLIQLDQYLRNGLEELAKVHPFQATVYAYLSCVLGWEEEFREQLATAKQELNRRVCQLAVNNARLAAEDKFDQIVDPELIKRKQQLKVIDPWYKLVVQVSEKVILFLKQVIKRYPEDEQLKVKLINLSVWLAIQDDD